MGIKPFAQMLNLPVCALRVTYSQIKMFIRNDIGVMKVPFQSRKFRVRPGMRMIKFEFLETPTY